MAEVASHLTVPVATAAEPAVSRETADGSVLPDNRNRLRQRRSRTSGTRTRRLAPTSSRGTSGWPATRCTSSPGWTSTGRRWPRPRRSGASRHRTSSTTSPGRFRAMWSKLGISYDQFIRTTEAGHKAGARALIKRIHASSPDDFYERRTRGGTASAVSSSSARTRSPTASASCTRRATCSGPRSGTGSSGFRATASS